jgi:hypothetical protein
MVQLIGMGKTNMFDHIVRVLPRPQTKPTEAELAVTRSRYLANASRAAIFGILDVHSAPAWLKTMY